MTDVSFDKGRRESSEVAGGVVDEEVGSDADGEGISGGDAVFVDGSGEVSFPVTMSASQSPIPLGTASTAVWGEYTLMPSRASLRSDCCWEFARVKDFRPWKMIGSGKC